MAVEERTSGGYVKGTDKNGNTFYRDPKGHPAKQQAFAGSKGGQAFAEKYDNVRDPDTGKFTGDVIEKEPPSPPTPPQRNNIRVTVTCKKVTNQSTGFAVGDNVTAKIEISGVFRPWNVPDSDDLREVIDAIREHSQGELGFFGDCDELNVERTPTSAPATGWRTEDLEIDFDEGKTYNYEVSYEQQKVTDGRWQD